MMRSSPHEPPTAGATDGGRADVRIASPQLEGVEQRCAETRLPEAKRCGAAPWRCTMGSAEPGQQPGAGGRSADMDLQEYQQAMDPELRPIFRDRAAAARSLPADPTAGVASTTAPRRSEPV